MHFILQINPLIKKNNLTQDGAADGYLPVLVHIVLYYTYLFNSIFLIFLFYSRIMPLDFCSTMFTMHHNTKANSWYVKTYLLGSKPVCDF